jgi:GTPase
MHKLTTQLLWRLQQSSSNHSGVYGATAAGRLLAPDSMKRLERALPGLEDSKGALYEIGVADDGTFVGLTQSELDESLETLSTMAATLGCVVDVLRKAEVGVCEWIRAKDTKSSKLVRESLWVAEAYVKPKTGEEVSQKGLSSAHKPSTETTISEKTISQPPVDQLRVSLTGPTMSGKSSLLGSLTMATLDNGRGLSRLSLLKHQHEIASGMTSSVTQELVGYQASAELPGNVEVVNYVAGSISSWLDIHAACEEERVVLLSDSAGHPRFRRTTVRGIVGWAPHWTLLCIPADNEEDTSGLIGSTPPPEEVLGMPARDVDLSQQHLRLCLALNLPLVIVITKMDLASKSGLKGCLSKTLSAVKAAGKTPLLLTHEGTSVSEHDLVCIPSKEVRQAQGVSQKLKSNPQQFVPILLTSAVRGWGLTKLHALLHQLPIPSHTMESSTEDKSDDLFDIEETYHRRNHAEGDISVVLGGVLRRGEISVGDELRIGPFSVDLHAPTGVNHLAAPARPDLPPSRSFPGALDKSRLESMHKSSSGMEWHTIRISSLRNLRLPVKTLHAGQVGTIGVMPIRSGSTDLSGVRKGMVLSSGSPKARCGFVADFARKDVDGLSIGSSIMMYFNSVRASARVVAGAIPSPTDSLPDVFSSDTPDDDSGFAFGFDDDGVGDTRQDGGSDDDHAHKRLLVTFQFIASREYVEVGSQVLAMPNGGAAIASIQGFVGKVTSVQS